MSEEIELLKFVCGRLEQVDIPYMLTGSFAANVYAVPRMTRDIDFVVEIYKEDKDRVFQNFKDDFYIESRAISEAIEHEGMFNIIHNELVLKVDFIIRKDSVYRRTEFQRRQRIQFADTEIWIVSPEDLIISKLCWAKDSLSEMQLNDVKNLFRSVKNIDQEYIQKWIAQLGLASIFEKVNSYA